MQEQSQDPFGARGELEVGGRRYTIYRLSSLEEEGVTDLGHLPYSIKVVLESLLRNCGDGFTTPDDVRALARWTPDGAGGREVQFKPARVLLQDFTGVPAVVDLAAMRDAMKKLGGDPAKINPLSPAHLVIDHSVQVDAFGFNDALRINAQLEFERNRERYEFL
ncbi:MAG TPA: aconitase family protein, partial [Herpetosiphonaceae bacterium]|nr:aconitase family protein [Herpetosiphonaceae bacterium]